MIGFALDGLYSVAFCFVYCVMTLSISNDFQIHAPRKVVVSQLAAWSDGSVGFSTIAVSQRHEVHLGALPRHLYTLPADMCRHL